MIFENIGVLNRPKSELWLVKDRIKLKGSDQRLSCDGSLMWMGQMPGWVVCSYGGFPVLESNSAAVRLAAVSGKGDSSSVTLTSTKDKPNRNRKHSNSTHIQQGLIWVKIVIKMHIVTTTGYMSHVSGVVFVFFPFIHWALLCMRKIAEMFKMPYA